MIISNEPCAVKALNIPPPGGAWLSLDGVDRGRVAEFGTGFLVSYEDLYWVCDHLVDAVRTLKLAASDNG